MQYNDLRISEKDSFDDECSYEEVSALPLNLIKGKSQ
jgi:hypothetical protein